MMNVQEELVVIKGKRTKRPRLLSPPGAITNMPSPTSNSSAGTIDTNNSGGLIDVATTTSTTATSEYELEDEDMAHCLILLAQGHHHHHTHKASPSSKHASASTQHDHNDHNNSLYKCKTCNRRFPSFQALGGHRASHKKPNNKSKGVYGIEEKQEGVTSFVSELDGDHDHHCDPTTTSTILSLQLSSSNNRLNLCGTSSTRSKPSATAKSKLHECSICGAEFSSGQALGGHMRRHRNFLSTSTTTTSMSGGNINIIGSTESQEAKKPRNVLKLDLNLPAAPEGDHQRESKFSFQTKENVIVFSASSLVDCHY